MEWSIKRNDTTDICRMYSEAINCIAKRPQSQGCSFQQILTHYGSYVAAELSLPLNQCTVKEEPVICSDPTRLSVLGFNVCLPAWEPFEAAFGFDGCTYITFLHDCFADRSESIGPKCSKSEVTAAVMSEGALTWLNANYKSLVPRMNSTCGI
ncbi:uncharacterized protein LOC127879996 isoform X2 [Dreissena polymorpha]|nr:uncharacterized protein LOC127879996 isoform X2 [Dreissena polymorpha]XP_052283131.1 uncharacterized protein LOC127879996 isoform X2 [Dreissena polymorpha]XP_052283132.1 uncharacterized protein LOC127879996 isoform X2 [Dreissena polymorpha]